MYIYEFRIIKHKKFYIQPWETKFRRENIFNYFDEALSVTNFIFLPVFLSFSLSLFIYIFIFYCNM